MRNKNNKPIISKDKNGEFHYNRLNNHIAKKYKADTPLDQSFIPYLILLFCGTVDAAVFLSVLKMLSYDSVFMLGIQCAGLLFGFDVVPIYIGIQLKRLKQGLEKDKFILCLSFVVCAIAVIINTALRILTIDQIAPDVSANVTSYVGTVDVNTAGNAVTPTAIALTVFGIALPLLTSIGSFFISYMTYNPLKVRLKREEEEIAIKKNEIRRLNAILEEYDADPQYAEHMQQIDDGKFHEMQKYEKALIINYCEYVRQRLKEYLANPTSHNALSEEDCIAIMDKLDHELARFERKEIPASVVAFNNTKREMDLPAAVSL